MIVLFLAAPLAAGGRACPEGPNIGGTGRHAVIQRPRASFRTCRSFLCIVLVHVTRSPGGWFFPWWGHGFLLTLFTAVVEVVATWTLSTCPSGFTALHKMCAAVPDVSAKPASTPAIIALHSMTALVRIPAAFATSLPPIVLPGPSA